MGTNDFPPAEAGPDPTSSAEPASSDSGAQTSGESGSSGSAPQANVWSAAQPPEPPGSAHREAESGADPLRSPQSDALIASTIEIPAQRPSDEEGGEWDLLVGKVRTWLNSDDPTALWSRLQLPLKVIAGLIVFLLVNRIYSGILGTIDSIPLAPGLLELAGLIWILNFAARNLVRSGDRKQLIDAIRTAWERVTGR